MPSPISRLRRLYPYLTPSWGGDDQEREGFMLDKTQGGIPLIRTPYDPLFHPTQVARRSKIAETWRTGRDDPQWNTEYSAAFPVSAVTGQVNPDQGYGIYNKGPLDPGYEPPRADDELRIPAPPERLSTPADILRTIPLLKRIPVNPVPFDESAPPPPIAGLTRLPTRLSDEQADEMGAPPMVMRRDGRPIDRFIGGGTPEERLLTRRRELEAYQPQKESKKSLFFRTLLGQLRGGLIGEGGSLDTLLGPAGAFDRRGRDRAWQQQQLGQVNEQYGQMKADRRAGLQDRLLESQVKKAETPTVPPLRNVQLGSAVLSDGRTVQMERTETGWKMSTTADGQPIITKPAASNKPKVVVNVPNIGPIEVTPEAALGYYGTSENRNFQRERDAQDASFTNAQVEANIKSTEQQLAKVSEALANTSEQIVTATYKDGGEDRAPNPRYNDLKNEQQQLQRELRDWQAKRKAPPVLTRGAQPDTRKGSINLRQWKADNPNATQADADAWLNRMKQRYPNAAIIN